MSLGTYVLTYWWDPPSGEIGVEEREGTSVIMAADAFGEQLHGENPRVAADEYEVLSAVYVAPYGLEVAAVNVVRDGTRLEQARHVTSSPRHVRSEGRLQYVVTGTEGFDDLRFANVVRADDLEEALLRVQEHLVDVAGSDGDDVRFWSAVERAEDGSVRVFWLDGSRFAQAVTHAGEGRGLEARIDRLEEVDVSEALAFVNRHRRAMGMSPLDPAQAGWSAQDVLLEAERVHRLPNLGLMP